jgi:hypothetical protein
MNVFRYILISRYIHIKMGISGQKEYIFLNLVNMIFEFNKIKGSLELRSQKSCLSRRLSLTPAFQSSPLFFLSQDYYEGPNQNPTDIF